jgi:predicted nucleotidyltransferase
MESVIRGVLEKIEKEHKVKILFACESGSKAWGFASKDSDYDVRFIYIHEKNWYFGIDDQRDVIELPVNEVLDVNGWDIRKALRLFRKSNAPLFEWLQSPVIYKEDKSFSNELFQLAPKYFLLRAGYHHYLSMTKSCFEHELQGDSVKVKKYFYALRPVLACQWIVDKQEMPPMEFAILRQLIPDELQTEVDKLLKLKEQGDEKLFTSRITSIHQFVEGAIKYCEENGKNIQEKQNPTEQLDILFRKQFD